MAKEKRKQPSLQLTRILAFLDYLKELPGTSEVKKKSLINIFVHSVHLYDDYFYIIFNAGNTTLRSENIPLKSIENSLKHAVLKTFSGSDFDAFVPPNKTRIPCGCVSYYAEWELNHSKRKRPVDCCPIPAGRNRHLSVIDSLGAWKNMILTEKNICKELPLHLLCIVF